jgi:RND family efflux transporter MFP subunit
MSLTMNGRLFGRRTAGALLLTMTVLALGCGRKPKADTAAAEAPPITLGRENIAVAERRELKNGPAISGALSPNRQATVRAEVSGTVLRNLLQQGQHADSGVLVLRIDEVGIRDAYTSAKSNLETARSSLELARRNAERSAALAQAGAIADRDLETSRWSVLSAEAAVAEAQSRVAGAEKQLAKTEVKAPFTGILSELMAKEGDVVLPGNPLFTLIDPASMQLEASVPVSALTRLKVGMPVEFGVSGYEGRNFKGRIDRINPTADPATRQVRIYVSIPNSGGVLVAGLYADGRVAVESKETLAAPFAAVDTRGTGPAVIRLRGSKVERVPVQLGLRDEAAEWIEIQGGVAAGDTLLLGTAQGLTEGATARVVGE